LFALGGIEPVDAVIGINVIGLEFKGTDAATVGDELPNCVLNCGAARVGAIILNCAGLKPNMEVALGV